MKFFVFNIHVASMCSLVKPKSSIMYVSSINKCTEYLRIVFQNIEKATKTWFVDHFIHSFISMHIINVNIKYNISLIIIHVN